MKEAAREDLVALADDVAALEDEVDRDPDAKEDYLLALEQYDLASQRFDRARTPQELEPVAKALDEGRYLMTRAKARLAGQALPERRLPCFFDPRHGPSVKDEWFTPPGGGPREVPVCAADAVRLEDGEQPESRLVQSGGRMVPYWSAPSHFGGYFGGFVPGLVAGSLLSGGGGGWDRGAPTTAATGGQATSGAPATATSAAEATSAAIPAAAGTSAGAETSVEAATRAEEETAAAEAAISEGVGRRPALPRRSAVREPGRAHEREPRSAERRGARAADGDGAAAGRDELGGEVRQRAGADRARREARELRGRDRGAEARELRGRQARSPHLRRARDVTIPLGAIVTVNGAMLPPLRPKECAAPQRQPASEDCGGESSESEAEHASR